ncbi:hypothetical protein IWZ03DRAFT_241560 [Phyllosticta citriasiana]|uniref:Uncharacterized protein n=1 Tax=Phyllosticta citriasiana TaxID=595635 RepID=A0ABR1KFH5_9PEZI
MNDFPQGYDYAPEPPCMELAPQAPRQNLDTSYGPQSRWPAAPLPPPPTPPQWHPQDNMRLRFHLPAAPCADGLLTEYPPVPPPGDTNQRTTTTLAQTVSPPAAERLAQLVRALRTGLEERDQLRIQNTQFQQCLNQVEQECDQYKIQMAQPQQRLHKVERGLEELQKGYERDGRRYRRMRDLYEKERDTVNELRTQRRLRPHCQTSRESVNKVNKYTTKGDVIQ